MANWPVNPNWPGNQSYGYPGYTFPHEEPRQQEMGQDHPMGHPEYVESSLYQGFKPTYQPPYAPPTATATSATPISGQPSDQADPCFPLVPGSQFISPGDDPRSRHSSAGSDHAPRSAPLSPMIGGGNQPDPVRTRHQSAGNVPSTATATIHYRPAWQHQDPADFNFEVSKLLSDQTCRPQSVPALAQMFHPGPYTASQPPTPGALDSSASFNYPGQGIVSGGPNQSHHSSYSNTPIPPAGAHGKENPPPQVAQRRNLETSNLLTLEAPGREECDYCHQKFVSVKSESYKSHLKNWHRIEKEDKNKLICSECFKIKQDKVAANRCKQRHKDDPNWTSPVEFICNNGICDNQKFGEKKKAFLQHLNRQHHMFCSTSKEPEKFICQYCAKPLSCLRGLGTHEKGCKDNPDCPDKNRKRGRRKGTKMPKKPKKNPVTTPTDPVTNTPADNPPVNPPVTTPVDNPPSNTPVPPPVDKVGAPLVPPITDIVKPVAAPHVEPPEPYPRVDRSPSLKALEDSAQPMDTTNVGRMALVSAGILDCVDSGGSVQNSHWSVQSFDSGQGMVCPQTLFDPGDVENLFNYNDLRP